MAAYIGSVMNNSVSSTVIIFLFLPMPPHVLMNFRGFSPGCGDSVADF